MRAEMRQFKITFTRDGWVDACVLEASSKYNAKKRFYLENPKAEIIKVEPLQTPDSFEQIVIEDGFEILGKED
jgi:hypothetical protein